MGKSENSKNKILIAARKIFAEKGYDGARVDEIAREAGINKAMLYYYFKSKDNILKEVVNNIALTYYLEKETRFNISDLIDEGVLNNEGIDSTIDDGLESIKENENVFRIILTESFKAINSDIVGVNVFDNILKRNLKDMRSLGFEIDDENDFMIKQFFFIIIPMFTFIALRDDWCEFYKIKEENLNIVFKNVLKQYNKLGIYPS